MRIALCQINPTVGDVPYNLRLILDSLDRAQAQSVQLAVFPELALVGYPPKDLLLKPDLLHTAQHALETIAKRCLSIAAIVGYPALSTTPTGRTLYNAAAICSQGKILHTHIKHLLPTYDVFDETRYFEPGPQLDLTQLHNINLGVSVCEDLWNDEQLFSRQLYHDNPIDQLAARGAQLFVNCSASPFVVRKQEFRLKLLQHTAKRYAIPIVYVNQVGGNDELIFDGNSAAIDAQGNLLALAKDFNEDLLVVDLPLPGEPQPDSPIEARIGTPSSGIASVYNALVLGLRDYCEKCGFTSLVLGLSGGIDSAVTAAIAAAAVGTENVTGIAMPSRYSSDHSIADAESLAHNLGLRYLNIPIESPHAATESLLTNAFAVELTDVTAQNIQARLRGLILMAHSNQTGAMLVSTGNKSEIAVGYCTLYGDMAGGLAVLSDVPKTMVYDLARFINTPDCPLYQSLGKPAIPDSSITKPPSAELRPDQTDQDSLPDYPTLDDIIERYIERHQSARQIITETSFDADTVRRIVRLIDRNEYKRKQAAPGLKITSRAFGFGRRMPIAQRFDPAADPINPT